MINILLKFFIWNPFLLVIYSHLRVKRKFSKKYTLNAVVFGTNLPIKSLDTTEIVLFTFVRNFLLKTTLNRTYQLLRHRQYNLFRKGVNNDFTFTVGHLDLIWYHTNKHEWLQGFDNTVTIFRFIFQEKGSNVLLGLSDSIPHQ